MSALEQQLIERIRQMDETSKQRVLEFIERDVVAVSHRKALEKMRMLRAQLKRDGQTLDAEALQEFIDDVKRDRP